MKTAVSTKVECIHVYRCNATCRHCHMIFAYETYSLGLSITAELTVSHLGQSACLPAPPKC